MLSHDFFNTFIDPRSHKVLHNLEERHKIEALDGIQLVKAFTLYQIYRHNVFENEGRLSMQEFYRVCGQYFYYDKVNVPSGTIYYYHVLFNEDNDIYQATRDLIERRVIASSPNTLKHQKGRKY